MSGASDPLELSFTAHGRDFNLRLFADHSVFHPEYKVTGPLDKPVRDVDHHLYEGHLVDEPGSHVFGVVRDGVFDGTIRTRRHGTGAGATATGDNEERQQLLPQDQHW